MAISIDLSSLPEVSNPIYWPAFAARERFLLLYGGSGSGKSWAAAQKLIVRALSEDRHRFLCCRKTASSVSKSQFPLLVDLIREWGMSEHFKMSRAAGQERIICLPTGAEFIFSGLDDVEKLKSISGITSIWIEEASEISIEDYRELNRRLRGYSGRNSLMGGARYMQILFTFNPISSLHWLKSTFFDNPPASTRIIHSTYRDNKFIEPSYGAELERLREESPYEYEVYALGRWGIVGGGFFDNARIAERIEQVQEPIRRGYFEYREQLHGLEAIRWVDDDSGAISIYAEPQKGHPYVLGADTAGEGSDYNVGQMIDNLSGAQVATIRQKHDEDLFAKQLYCLGMHYNTALIGVETNFSTHPMQVLSRLRYSKQYVREQSPDAFTGRLQDKYGFVTTAANRMDMLGRLRSLVRMEVGLLNDLPTLHEMTTFVRNERGKPEAGQGFHDDCIMALAIAHAIRGQQRMSIVQQLFDLSEFPEDLQEDYWAADDSMRQYMLRKWGLIGGEARGEDDGEIAAGSE